MRGLRKKYKRLDVLKQRIITAIVLLIPVFWVLWFGSTQDMAIAAGLVILLAGLEWARFSRLDSVTGYQVYLLLLVAAMFVSLHTIGFDGDRHFNHGRLIVFLQLATLLWLAIALWVKGYPGTSERARRRILRWVANVSKQRDSLTARTLLNYSLIIRAALGVVILVALWLALIAIKAQANGHWLLLWLIVIVVLADTGAYFCGRRWGKHKLAPEVSPGKSWEGFFGGLACNAVASLVVGLFLSLGAVGLLTFVAVSLATAVASVYGDLCESMLKRDQSIKDSGSLLPGHGGIMDRIDSLTAAAPVYALGLSALGWL